MLAKRGFHCCYCDTLNPRNHFTYYTRSSDLFHGKYSLFAVDYATFKITLLNFDFLLTKNSKNAKILKTLSCVNRGEEPSQFIYSINIFYEN